MASFLEPAGPLRYRVDGPSYTLDQALARRPPRLGEAAPDLGQEAGPPVDEPGVDLHRVGARVQEAQRVVGAEDAARADDEEVRRRRGAQPLDGVEGASEDGAPRQPPFKLAGLVGAQRGVE